MPGDGDGIGDRPMPGDGDVSGSGREQLAGLSLSVSVPQTHQDRKRDVLRFVDMSYVPKPNFSYIINLWFWCSWDAVNYHAQLMLNFNVKHSFVNK